MITDKIKDPGTGSVTISYSFLSVATLCLLVITTVLFICDHFIKLSLRLADYMSLCSFGCVTIGLIYNAISLQYHYTINRIKFAKEADAESLNKTRFTYEVTAVWYTSDMANNVEVTRRMIRPYKGLLNRPEKLAEFTARLEADDHFEQHKCLFAVLNYFENLSLLAEDNIIDEEILKKCFRTVFIIYYNNLKEFIENEQRGNNGANAKTFIHFITLCRKWI